MFLLTAYFSHELVLLPFHPLSTLGGNSAVGDYVALTSLSLTHKAVHQPQLESSPFMGDPSAREAGHLGWSVPWIKQISACSSLYSTHWLGLPTVPWPHKHDHGYMLQGLDDPTGSLLETTIVAHVGSNFFRLKKVQVRGCFSWKTNPATKQKCKK